MKVADFFSRYEIDYTQSLDQKGLGSVYTAKENESGEIMALKVIELHPMFDKGETLARYEKAAAMSHPNLLQYKLVLRYPGEDTIQHFVLMPYVEEGTLQDRLSGLGFYKKVEILNAVLNGLSYLHQNSIVWQCLRSDHILLPKEEGEYVLKFINYGAEEALPKAFFTNYEYMAPEQFAETATACDTKIDLWAFGVLAFELFTGQLPFGRKTPQTPNRRIMERIQAAEIADLFLQIPDSYAEVIKKCLKTDPAERWKNIEEIINFLKEKPTIPKARDIKEVGILETLEKMGETYVEEPVDPENLPLFQRKFKRKPSRPIQWWEPFFWIGLASLVGYLLSKL
jgi:serine/threonine-protein kinase